MCTHPKCTIRVLLHGTLQIRTAGVLRFRVLQIAVYGVVNYRERWIYTRCKMRHGTSQIGIIYVHTA